MTIDFTFDEGAIPSVEAPTDLWIGAFGPVEMRAEVVAFHDKQAATFQLFDD